MKKTKQIIVLKILMLIMIYSTNSYSQKTAVKANVISPLIEYLNFSVERNIANRQSVELGIGIIGIGRPQEVQKIDGKDVTKIKDGFFISGGYKIILASLNKDKTNSPFLGYYIQPKFYYGKYEKINFQTFINANGESSVIDLNENQKINYRALLLQTGFKYFFSSHFFIDAYLGVGLGNDNVKRRTHWLTPIGISHRGIYKTGGGKSLATNAGIKLGFAF